MATYNELTRQYNSLPAYAKPAFRRDHPNWWQKYQAQTATPAPPATQPPGTTQPPPPAQTPEVEEDERPPKPAYSPGAGYAWVWDETVTEWVARRSNQEKYENDLFAEYTAALEQYGFKGTDVSDFLRQSVREDWNDSTFTIKMRQQDWYLANPLFKANMERARNGARFMSEGEILDYADTARQFARQFGYAEPSDAYIAQGLLGGLSKAEIEHRFRVDQRMAEFGGGVALVYEALNGRKPNDADLYKIFDPEISTEEFERNARQAEYRGRPMLLGLGVRPAEEGRALEMLGINTEQAWEGYKKLANSLPTVERLAAIDQAIANDPNNPFDSFGALWSSIFREDPKTQEQLAIQQARERARFNVGGTPAGQGGMATGLLSTAERQTFG